MHSPRTPSARRPTSLALLAAIAMVCVSCGGSDGGGDEEAAEAEAAVDALLPRIDEDAPEPTPGGEIVIGTIFDPFGLEPTTFVGGITDAAIALALYDPLMMYTPEGTVEPWLASSMESEDSQTWTLTLQEGVTFQDGTPFDAEAVKVNLERHMDPASSSRALGNASNIEAVTVVDPSTVEIRLRFPWPAFPEVLTGNLGLMASPEAIAGGDLDTSPVGTGPFRLEERVPGDHTTVVRNEDYWRDGEPYLDRITYRVLVDDSVRQASLENGEIHLAQSIRGDTMIAAVEADGIGAVASPGFSNVISMNTTTAPTDDVRVRQALALALDTESMDEVIFDGTADSAGNPLSPESSFFAEDAEFPTYDPDRARELVEEIEAEQGPLEIEFSCYTEPSRVQLTEMVEQMWEQVGITVETVLKDQRSQVLDILQKNYMVGCYSMGSSNRDPDLQLYANFHSESPSSSSGYASDEMDQALEAGRTGTDEADRRQAYATAQRLLAEDVPVFQYASAPWGWVVRDEVHGVVALPGAEPIAGRIFIEPEA
jgi:peptide/nickel transport system substrate-binding protein